MSALFLDRVDESLGRGETGAVFTLNTNDRYVVEPGVTPVPLKETLARHLVERYGFTVATYSTSRGVGELQLPGLRPSGHSPFNRLPGDGDPDEILMAVDALFDPPAAGGGSGSRVALIVDHADNLAPASPGTAAMLHPVQQRALEILHSWGTEDRVRTGGHFVALISHANGLNELLRSGGYRTIPVDLPAEKDRRTLIDLIMAERSAGRSTFGTLAEDLSEEELAGISGGLRIVDILQLFRHAASAGVPVTRRAVSARKTETIRELGHGLLEVVDQSYGLDDLAGLPHLKEFVRDCLAAGGLPQGMILAGPPGQGKSHSVRAIAREMGVPCLAMRNVRSRWVGDSERNLNTCLQIADTLSPCIVWIDELDQAIGQRSTSGSADGGTSERMLARLWEFMGDTAAGRRITWIGTTNRPDLLDPATLDRFGVVVPFVHPSPEEVAALIPILAQQRRRVLSEDVDTAALAVLPSLQLPTVRELHEVLDTAARWADVDAGVVGAAVTHSHLEEAARDVKRTYDPLLHEFIALTALRMGNRHSLMPWRGRHGARTDVAPPNYVVELLDPDGYLDEERLQKRLVELEHELAARRAGR